MARTKQEVRNWLNAQVGKQVNANAGIYSGQCHPAGTFILMANGNYKLIEDIEIGDEVYNHDGTSINTVTELFNRVATTYLVDAGDNILRATEEHPIFTIKNPVRYSLKQQIREGLNTEKLEADFVRVGDIRKGDAIETPIIDASKKYDFTDDALKLIGYYLGDGCRDKDGRVYFCGGSDKKEKFINSLKLDIGLRKTTRTVKVYELHKSEKELHNFIIDNLNHLAHDKRVPLVFDKRQAKVVLDGYRVSDFCESNQSGNTVSKQLALSLSMLAKIAGYSSSIRYIKKSPTAVIEGRVVNQRDAYSVSINMIDTATKSPIQFGGRYFKQVRKVSEYGVEEVFNFETDGDHTYIADNIGVHNCVSLAKALLEYLGAPNPYKARGHAKDYADTLLREGIAKNSDGWLRVVVNRNMGKIGGVTYGHIWIDLANEANYEQNGAIALRTTKNTRPYSQRQQVVNLDKYIKSDAPAKKSNEAIAKEVLDGKWGNGPTRIAKLKAAGYDYNAIQRIVNDLVAGKPVAKYHTVKKGDTMSGIAAKYKISLGRLIQLNPQIKNINVISVGQKVRVK